MPSLDLKARIRETILRHPSATRAEVSARVKASVLCGYGLSLIFFIAVGSVRVGPRPFALVAGGALGAALVAAIASWVALGRGGEMAGRSRHALAFAVTLTPLALLGWRLLWDAGFDPVPWHTTGFRCFGLLIVFSAGPLAALCFVRRGVDPVHPRLLGAALAIASGAYATMLVDLWCPSSELGHLLLGHFAPFGLLLWAGASSGARAVALRR